MDDETLAMLEEAIQSNLELLNNSRGGLSPEEREALVEEISILSERLNEAVKTVNQSHDMHQRRNNDIEIRREELKCEKKKLYLGWIEAGIKVGVPILTIVAYGLYQKRVLEFEETGKLKSDASRWLSLPRFW